MVNNVNSNYKSTWFNQNANSALSMMKNNSSSSNNLTSLMNDYAMLKTTGYRSLIKANYADLAENAINKPDKKTETDKLTESEQTNLNLLKKDSAMLKEDAMDLVVTGNKSLFKQDKDGNYDTEKIATAVSDFVKSYNNTLSSLSNSKDARTLQNGVFMTNTTKAFSKSLENIGISVGKDNKLSIDEKKFSAAKTEDIKSVFNGASSYASNVALKATQISNSSQLALTYNKSGSMNYAYSNVYSMLV